MSLAGWAKRSLDVGISASPQADVALRRVLILRKMAFMVGVGEGLRTRTMVAVSLSPSLKTYNSFFCFSLLWATVLLLDLRVIACEQDFVCCPLRGHLGFLQTPVSYWCREGLLIFTARCYKGSSSHHWFLGWGVSVDWEPSFPIRKFCNWDICSKSQLLHVGVRHARFRSLSFLSVSVWPLL